MTSGTSGCEQHGFAKNEMEAVKFAYLNKDSLTQEIAEGQGEYLAGLAHAINCREEVATFSRVAQENYAAIAGSSDT